MVPPLPSFPFHYTRRPHVVDESTDVPSTSDVSSSSSRPTYCLRSWPCPPPDRCSPSRYGLSTVLEPTSYRDAIVHPDGQFAMAEEIAALERTGTWDLVSLPPGVHPITCKWVYEIKTRSYGSLERYKAHLVARGFQ